MERRHVLRVALTAAAVLLADGITKLLTVTVLEEEPIDLGWVVLRSARNTGVSFGLGADSPAWIVLSVTVGATLVIMWMALRGVVQPAVAGGLLVGGGLGNLIDRIGDGAVVDMVDLGWFPVFNVADVALNVGVALVLLHGLLVGDPDEAADTPDEAGESSDASAGDAPSPTSDQDEPAT